MTQNLNNTIYTQTQLRMWELDSIPLNFRLNNGRHAIIGIFDVSTQRLKMLVNHSRKATSVTDILRHCIDAWGVPEMLKTDSGSDCASFNVKQTLMNLGVQQVFSPAFQPWHRPHIERSLRNFSRDLIELKPFFCSDNVAKLDMTSEQLQKHCDDWCENNYSGK